MNLENYEVLGTPGSLNVIIRPKGAVKAPRSLAFIRGFSPSGLDCELVVFSKDRSILYYTLPLSRIIMRGDEITNKPVPPKFRVNSRVRYYLLDWKDRNMSEYLEMFGEKKLGDLSQEEIINLLEKVQGEDLNRLKDSL